ncbi:MAG: signal peptidase I [Lachnospiraceae bacterium]|nr:signal peptidase I [Lachnospiraceae bacterium]
MARRKKGRREKERRREKTYSLGKTIRRWVFFILILVLLTVLAIVIANNRTVATGNDMYPTISNGDLLVEDRISLKLLRPSRDDLITFSSRYEEGVRYIRRVVGLPGETVEIRDGSVYINGVERKEKAGIGMTTAAGTAINRITLGEEEYFVMCDDREVITDSREPTIGNIRLDEMEGRILFRLWPDPGLL